MQMGSAISRHELGTQLRQIRTARSLRLEDAAVKLGVAPSTLSRIENGLAPTRTSYLSVLLDLYGVDDPARRTQLKEMAVAGQRKDWWADFAGLLPAGTGTYLGLEAIAQQVRGYAAHTVPALLQSRAYAEAFVKATRPELKASEIGGLVKLQLQRQQLLDRDGTRIDLILDESVLLRSVGSAQVMVGQLAHLLALADESAVTVRVIEMAAAQPVLSSSFTLLSLPATAESTVACLETIAGQVDVSRRTADVQAMQTVFEALAARALSPARSGQLIGKYADNLI